MHELSKVLLDNVATFDVPTSVREASGNVYVRVVPVVMLAELNLAILVTSLAFTTDRFESFIVATHVLSSVLFDNVETFAVPSSVILASGSVYVRVVPVAIALLNTNILVTSLASTIDKLLVLNDALHVFDNVLLVNV